MLNRDILKSVEDSVKEVLEPLGFVLIELKSMRTADGIILRFLIDRQEGGITLGECTKLNNQIGQLLGEKNIINDNYILEVSSPGLDRSLVDLSDFRRAQDKKIHIFLKETQDGKLEFEGKLIKCDAEKIIIINNENKEQFIPFSKINKAKKVIK